SRSPPSRRLSAATPATSTSTLSLHDALPISECLQLNLLRISGRNKIAQCCIKYLGRYLFHILGCSPKFSPRKCRFHIRTGERLQDRKSTRLNSSHVSISYAVFCLKKKKYISC